MNKVQQRLFEMSVIIKSVLEKYNIPYTITYGTLLGAIRHNGFIPWDDDFDFYLFDESYDYAINALRKSLPTTMFVEDEQSEPKYFHGWAHIKDKMSYVECNSYPNDGLYSHHGLSVDLYKATLINSKDLFRFQKKQHELYLNRKYSKGIIDVDLFTSSLRDLDKKYDTKNNYSDIITHTNYLYGLMSLDGDFMTLQEIFPLRSYIFEGEHFFGMNSPHEFLTRCYGNYMELPPIEKRIPHYSKVIFK